MDASSFALLLARDSDVSVNAMVAAGRSMPTWISGADWLAAAFIAAGVAAFIAAIVGAARNAEAERTSRR